MICHRAYYFVRFIFCLVFLLLLYGCTSPPTSFFVSGSAVVFSVIFLFVLFLFKLFGVAVSTFAGQTIAYYLSLASAIIAMTFIEYNSKSKNIIRIALFRSICTGGLFTSTLIIIGLITGIPIKFGYWGLFTVAFMFTLLFGDLYVRAGAIYIENRIDNGEVPSCVGGKIKTSVRCFRKYQEYQYLIFLVAPIFSLFIKAKEIIPTLSWFYIYFLVALSLIGTSNLVSLFLLSPRLAECVDVSKCKQLSQFEVESIYKLSSDARTLYFIDMFHTLIVSAGYIFGVYLLIKTVWHIALSEDIVYYLAIFLGVPTLILLFLSYYTGQYFSIHAIISKVDKKNLSMPFYNFKNHLYNISPLTPTGADMKFLLLSVTAGGTLIILFEKALDTVLK